MKSFKKVIALIVLSILLVQVMSFNVVNATSFENDITHEYVKIEEGKEEEYEVTAITTSTIAVWIGGVIVGYITASVIDGIVISATGNSGAVWVAEAISRVVNRPYQSSVTLPADFCGGDPWCTYP